MATTPRMTTMMATTTRKGHFMTSKVCWYISRLDIKISSVLVNTPMLIYFQTLPSSCLSCSHSWTSLIIKRRKISNSSTAKLPSLSLWGIQISTEREQRVSVLSLSVISCAILSLQSRALCMFSAHEVLMTRSMEIKFPWPCNEIQFLNINSCV